MTEGKEIMLNFAVKHLFRSLALPLDTRLQMNIFANIKKTKPDSLTSQGLPGINTGKAVLSFD